MSYGSTLYIVNTTYDSTKAKDNNSSGSSDNSIEAQSTSSSSSAAENDTSTFGVWC